MNGLKIKKVNTLCLNERRIILENLNMVDKVIEFDDDDNWAPPALKIKSMYPNQKIIFCNEVIEILQILENLM